MFPQPYVPTFLRIFFSLTILKIRPYVPTALCSHISKDFFSLTILKIWPYVPTALCSQIYLKKLVPMFPQPYVLGLEFGS